VNSRSRFWWSCSTSCFSSWINSWTRTMPI